MHLVLSSKTCRNIAVSFFAVFVLASSCQALAETVLTFDDLSPGTILTGSTYAGLTWETGNIAADGHTGLWGTVFDAGFNYPHSLPRNIINGYGPTLIGISFPGPVNIGGAFISGQGGSSVFARDLKVHGYLNGLPTLTTDVFRQISSTPAWFDMSMLKNVDRIVFEATPVRNNAAYYGLDDFTFTYIPEPGTLGLLGIGGFTLLARRRAASSR